MACTSSDGVVFVPDGWPVRLLEPCSVAGFTGLRGVRCGLPREQLVGERDAAEFRADSLCYPAIRMQASEAPEYDRQIRPGCYVLCRDHQE